MGRRGPFYPVYNLRPVWEAAARRGMSLAEVARRAGIQRNSLYRLAKVPDRQPTYQTAQALATVVGVSVDDLIVGVEQRDAGEETAQEPSGAPVHARVR